MRLRLPLCLAAAAALAVPAAAGADTPTYAPGQVVVQYQGHQTPQVLPTAPGQSVPQTVRELNKKDDVAYAVPNVIAHASGFTPDDPGRGGRGNWQRLQWNFLPANGIDLPSAWSNLIAAHRPGGRGVTVAILDTGVAYRTTKHFLRSPDFAGTRFANGYDFVDHDRFADDQNGHGTFVAGVVAERVNNGRALTGIAYGATIMPVRVLDASGFGDAAAIASAIRYSANRGAKVINLSLEFDSAIASQIPEVLSAIRYADRRGSLVVAASGNEAEQVVAYPARANGVMSVGATTEHQCQAEYSNAGPGLDVVAPGGGADADIPDDPHCRVEGRPGRDIFQLTFFTGSPRHFGLPGGYEGTSMATPHVAGVAALVIASGVVGPNPTPKAVEDRIKSTARDLGAPGYDQRYGWGLVDAGRATTPSPALRAAWKRR